MRIPIHRIIPFSNVEGYGNRTSIFVQGCNANCLYCHNSETIPMTSKDATLHTVEELLKIIKNQMPFIRGITVSGGEATLYSKFLIELFHEVHKLGLTCYIDTNGFFDYDQLLPLINVTDKFLYDIKGIGPSLEKLCFSTNLIDINHLAKDAKERFSKNNEHVASLKKLLEIGKVEEVRLVYVKNYFDVYFVIDEIQKILADYPKVLFKLIRMHSRGLPKERLLLLKGNTPSKKDYKEITDYVETKGFNKLIIIE